MVRTVNGVIFCLICMICFILFPCTSNASDISIVIDGEAINTGSWEVKPFIQNNRVMVPLRTVAEKLGAFVGWNYEQNFAHVIMNDHGIKALFILGVSECRLNANSICLDVPPYIKNGKTIVPLRTLAEILFCKVTWDEKSKTVLVSTAMPNSHNSPEWDQMYNVWQKHNGTNNNPYFKKFLFELYALANSSEKEGTISLETQGGVQFTMAVSENGNMISISHNVEKSSHSAEFISLRLLLGHENFIGNGDGLLFDMDAVRRKVIEGGGNVATDITATGETDKYSYIIKEYNQSGGYLGTCDLREVLIIRKTNG